MSRSRLSKRFEQQTIKTLFFTIVGIVAILFVLLKFGVPALANISLFISGAHSDTAVTKKSEVFIPPPFLDSLPNATNSAQTSISGRADIKQTIKLYVNGDLIDKAQTKDDKTFSFTDVTLSSGQNSIKVKAVTTDKKESDYSNEISITYQNKAPTLTLNSPTDGQSFLKDTTSASVAGKTDPGVKVTVNEFWAIVDDSGKFSYTLPLVSGENKIKIVATDEAGNKIEMEKKVTYSP